MKAITNLELARQVVAGTRPETIADKLGVTPSAISQAINSPDVQVLIAGESARQQDAKKFDDRYDSLEDKVMGLLEQRIPLEGRTMKLRELTQVTVALNGMKRRTGIGSQNGQLAPQVNLMMPVQIAAKIVMSDRSEIVEIDGRTMVTANPDHVFSLAEVHNAQPKQIADIL